MSNKTHKEDYQAVIFKENTWSIILSVLIVDVKDGWSIFSPISLKENWTSQFPKAVLKPSENVTNKSFVVKLLCLP